MYELSWRVKAITKAKEECCIASAVHRYSSRKSVPLGRK